MKNVKKLTDLELQTIEATNNRNNKLWKQQKP